MDPSLQDALATNYRTVCLVGGTGFVGHHIANDLVARGHRVRVLTRRRERHKDLLVYPTLELVETNVHYVSDLSAAFEGCDAVINLAGILNERGGGGASFRDVHADLPRKVIEACGYNRIRRLLHMSALNAAIDAPSAYLRSKAEGEEAVRGAIRAGMEVTIFRPSVIFGPDDSFFNRFATLLRMSPLVFPLACPDARFAPVFVDDVALAFVGSIADKRTFGESYDLCGPREYTLHELVEYTASCAGLARRVIPLSDRLSRLQAQVLERVPGKPFSLDNYHSLQVDSVCAGGNGFEALGIEPRHLEAQVPRYLTRRNRSALLNRLRGSAGRREA